MGEKTFHVSVTSSSQGINVKPESGGQSINTTVSVTSQKNININAATKQNPIGATSDTGLYYSQLSKNWAIGEGLIQNEDYSSKTWAAESKSSADLSKMYSEAASLDYNNLSDTINQYNEQISGVVADGINTIETTKTEASEYVETTANESIAEVNQAKEQAIKDFNKASDKVNYLFVMPIGHIGFSPFPIDETKGLRRILNGQIIIQEQFDGFVMWLKDNIKLYPQMACTEEEWQATVTMSTYGQCGKFVIDDEAGTIRLPKITGFIQGLTDLASLGELVEAGLPSISHTHTRGTMNITGSINNGDNRTEANCVSTGAFYKTGKTQAQDGHTSTTTSYIIGFDASKSWTGATSTNSAVPAVYGKSTTVQPESIRYPYFIQVATGAEESVDVTREIELNNPFFFGYYQYFEIAPNNISWLKSEGQWNSKAVYTDYYDWILTNANNGVENFKLSTDTYDDYAWVVNTADETFRLPIKTKNAPFTISGAKTTLSMGALSIKGNGKALGMTDGSTNFAFGKSSTNTTYISTADFGGNVGADVSDNNASSSVNKAWGITTNASKSGLTGSVSGTATTSVTTSENTNVSLYFYVGETTQNANLVNVGRIEETVVNKINRTGDTMTGKLNYNFTSQEGNGVEAFRVRIKDNNYTIDNNVVPAAEKRLGGIGIFDANDTNIGNVYMYKNKNDQVAMGMNVMRTINGATKTSYVRIYVDNTGQPLIDFPKCTTKATTTSSAKNMLPAVITQNYVSGTSWYRVWSDGWIEQGGCTSSITSDALQTVTFTKAFSAVPYVNPICRETVGETGEISTHLGSVTTKNFTCKIRRLSGSGTDGGVINWYACGY